MKAWTIALILCTVVGASIKNLLPKGEKSPLYHTTTIIVAQRVSSVKHADLILVLDGGEIIGSGNHETLMETCGVYTEIAESQMGGAILD